MSDEGCHRDVDTMSQHWSTGIVVCRHDSAVPWLGAAVVVEKAVTAGRPVIRTGYVLISRLLELDQRVMIRDWQLMIENSNGSASSVLPSPVPDNPRTSMQVLPGFLQPILTWITGQPLPGQRPWRLRPIHHLLASIAPLAAGVSLGVLLIRHGWWVVLIPISWILTTHGMRKLRAMILHQCSHGNFFRNRQVDSIIGHLIAFLFITQEYANYRLEHASDHHSVHHMTMRDPTVQFLIIGLKTRPRMSRRRMWSRLWITIFSPYYHISATYTRVASHFRGTSVGYRAAMIIMLAGQVLFVTLTGKWLVFILVWLFPLTALFNASAVIRVCTRHLFPIPDVVITGKDAIASHTNGIFLGDEVPDAHVPPLQRLVMWMRWWLRIAFVHLPARLFVMVGDAPCHDYHHRFPRSPDWANYLFARQQDLQEGHAGWPPYTEVWGMTNAINAVFDSLYSADPHHYNPCTVPGVSSREFLIFEE
jgi:fatty acid desaturase